MGFLGKETKVGKRNNLGDLGGKNMEKWRNMVIKGAGHTQKSWYTCLPCSGSAVSLPVSNSLPG